MGRLTVMIESPDMSQEEALYTLCLLAAFADGDKNDQEREELKQIGESLLPEGVHPSSVYSKVLLGQTDAATEAARLERPEWRRLAYEMAVKVCDADGVTTPAEKDFLQDLADHLKIPPQEAAQVVEEGEAFALAGPDELDDSQLPTPPPLPEHVTAKDDLDQLIMRYSIINGALELLPESLSTMAIIPLQMKLVNSVGKHHGISMDKRQLVEFLGAAGIGATSQAVEGVARKMLGRLGKRFGRQLLGKTGGKLATKGVDQLTSSAFSFASTWAIGQLARRYYANGRSWAGFSPRETFLSLQDQAESLHAKLLPEIQSEASALDYRKVLSMVRGR